MSDAATSKQRLRDTLRQRRRDLDAGFRRSAGKRLYARVRAIPYWDRMQHIAGYVAADGEIDPAALLQRLHDNGKHLYLPVVAEGRRLDFARWIPGERLTPNRYAIPEPGPDSPRRRAGELDAILLPLVGWNRGGQRLGMGGGFYDRSLSGDSGVLKVGLGYEVQEWQEIPAEPWDINMDYVATEATLHVCRGGAGGARRQS